jgi:hypothetical protein
VTVNLTLQRRSNEASWVGDTLPGKFDFDNLHGIRTISIISGLAFVWGINTQPNEGERGSSEVSKGDWQERRRKRRSIVLLVLNGCFNDPVSINIACI